jgi:type II secretory pathway component GspD/PulD (secretin)
MPTFAQTMVLEVIPLKYRAAEQVIPVLQPMLPPGASVSGFQNQLVVRTTPDNLQELRRILASLDAAPRRLLITVMQETDRERERRAAGISGSVGGEHGRVTVPENAPRRGAEVVLRDGDDHLRARALESRAAGGVRASQTLQVLEGSSAFIQTGRAAPVTTRRVERSVVGGRVVEQVVESTDYREALTGFYVLPRVSGDRVMLEVSPQREAFSRRAPGAIDVQRVVTALSGRLGEWIEVGGVGETRSEERSTAFGAGGVSAAERTRVLIKVEELR